VSWATARGCTKLVVFLDSRPALDSLLLVKPRSGACKCHSLAVFLPYFLAVPRLSVTSDPPLLLEINCLVLGEPRTKISKNRVGRHSQGRDKGEKAPRI
jgi:hypothetical protein